MPRYLVPSQITGEEGTESPAGTSFGTGSRSVRLFCVSSDIRSVHALAAEGGRYFFETRSIPLEDNIGLESIGRNELPRLIRTALPEKIQSALEVDPPIELLCLDGESVSRKPMSDSNRQNLLTLCLYTRKAAFVLQLDVTGRTTGDGYPEVAVGGVVSVDEPFERYLLFSTTIVRIRAAPRSREGYAVVGPPGCMAVLIENTETSEYTLYLHHGDGLTSAPLSFGLEQLERVDQVVDFCFAQSNGLSIFPSMAVLLLKRNGDVLAATPIVMDGTVVARSLVKEGLDYLAGELASLERSKPKWRQCRAAQQYLMDVFPSSDGRSNFSTARLGLERQQSAGTWPAKVQGPVLFASASEPGPPALSIEAFGNTDMAGIAVGSHRTSVDFGLLSPTSLLPRFSFETADDGYDLDDSLVNLGGWVERVCLGKESTTRSGNACLSIIRDSVDDTLLHCVTPISVATISTNALKMADRQLKGESTEPVRTTAWTCINVGLKNSNASVQGAVISADPQLGHELIARIDDGSVVPIDVAQSQSIHEIESMFEGVSEKTDALITSGTSNQALDALPPLYEVVEPLVKKLKGGLAGMGMIVGSETRKRDISLDLLAVAIEVKERCDKTVVLPMMGLKNLVDTRRENLKSVMRSQRDQLKELKQKVADLKGRMNSICSKLEIAESNASRLSERSSGALQASHDLLPSLTQAEHQFILEVKRLDAKVKTWEKETKQLGEAVKTKYETIDSKAVEESLNGLNSNLVQHANTLLKSQQGHLKEAKERIDKTKRCTAELAHAVGVESTLAGGRRSDHQ